MGQTQSTFLTELSWNMTQSPDSISFYVDGVKNISIEVPIQGEKSKTIKFKGDYIKLNDLFNKLHKIYKPYKNKIDHVFFEGLSLIEIKNNTAYMILYTGS